MTPYTSRKKATQSANALMTQRKESVVKVEIARINMRVAETKDELEMFEQEPKIIVIRTETIEQGRMQYTFAGPIVTGKPNFSPIPGADFCRNGFQQFTKVQGMKRSAYERALHLLKEFNRQGQSAATLATCEFQILETIINT